MNEETIVEKRPTNNGQRENKKEDNAWKYVTLGGISGILMGAGLMYTEQAIAATEPTPDASEETNDASPAVEQQSATSLPVAQLHNDLSFGEAFAAARAEVGAGGVFLWYGGIYNTYTADEWNAMSQEQKKDFAHQVNPEYRAHEISTPTDNHPDVAINTVDQDVVTVATDDDVHIVGYSSIEGHIAVGLDMNGDGQADVAIIDVDDNQELSDPDLVVDREGNYATVGEIAGTSDPNMEAYSEAPDMTEGSQTNLDYPVLEI